MASYTSTAAVRDIVDMAMEDRKHDPFGSVVSTLFDLCDVLCVAGFEVPAEAEYRPALALTADTLDDYWARELLGVLDADSSADEVFVYWIRVLLKYRALVVAAGRDY